MKIYTKTGDGGTSALIGRSNIPKSDSTFELLGTLDEFSAFLGLAKVEGANKKLIEEIQQNVIAVSGHIAGGRPCDYSAWTCHAEEKIDSMCSCVGDFNGFILYGKCPQSAALDVARSVVRRFERLMAGCCEKGFPQDILAYFNRLSDLLYIMARYEETAHKVRGKVAKMLSTVNLSHATRLAQVAREKAEEMGINICVAVADSGANIILMHSMDNAYIASTQIAEDKAYTAVALKMKTQMVQACAKPGGVLEGLVPQNRLVFLRGGAPIKKDGMIIGGIGISGGTASQDAEIADYCAEFGI